MKHASMVERDDDDTKRDTSVPETRLIRFWAWHLD